MKIAGPIDLIIGEVQFEAQPINTSVKIGEDAYFNCTYTGFSGPPVWSINGITFYSLLPRYHYRTASGIMVAKVRSYNNNTSYQCILLTRRSTVGTLTIRGKNLLS